MATKRILNKRSSVVENEQPKLPTADMMEYGEIALNYAAGKETLSIKNSNNSIVSVPINRQKLKEMVFADMWTARTGYTYENDVFKDDTGKTYTYENAVKKYHALITFANGYNYVDLGLPSGLLWADRNVGAVRPEGTGLYFQWGDIKGYKDPSALEGGDTPRTFDWTTYKYGSFDSNAAPNYGLTKYNNSDIVSKTNLDVEDDAARISMGGDWRIPSAADIVELFANTNVTLHFTNNTFVTTSSKGELDISWNSGDYNEPSNILISYVKFANKTDPTRFIIIPANGAVNGNENANIGKRNYLWLSNSPTYLNLSRNSVSDERIANGWSLTFNVETMNIEQNLPRCNGASVRGVVMPNNYK